MTPPATRRGVCVRSRTATRAPPSRRHGNTTRQSAGVVRLCPNGPKG
jgi:hypothetical protein